MSDQRLVRIHELEKIFAEHPIPFDGSAVYVGTAICTDNGEIFDIVVAKTFEDCLQKMLRLAKRADYNTLDEIALKLKFLEDAFWNGRYGTKGGLVCSSGTNLENGIRNLNATHTICYKEIT